MPKLWLLKTEPSVYSFTQFQKDGATTWDGVKNNTALIHLRNMKKGDRAFIYHTGDEKQIVGIAEIVSEPYPDPKLSDPKLVVVDMKVIAALKNPVTLATIKARKDFQDFELVIISRLGVMPVSEERWKKIIELSEE